MRLVWALVVAAPAGCLAEDPEWLGPPPCEQIPTTDTPLAEAAADLEEGEWAEFVSVGLERRFLDNGSSPRLIDTDSAVWVPGEQRLLLAAGTVLSYEAPTNLWEEITDVPWGCTDCTNGGDANALDPIRGFFYFRLFFGEELWRQDLGSGVWTELPLPPEPLGSHSSMTFFPEIDRLLLVDSTSVWAFDAGSQEWTTQFDALEIGNQSFAEYVPAHGVVVFGGGRDPVGAPIDTFYVWDGSAEIRQLGAPPIQLGAGDSIITADARTGELVVLADPASTHALDPIADVWRELPMSPVFAATFMNSVGEIAAAADTTHCVSIYLARGSDAHMYLYRHAPG